MKSRKRIPAPVVVGSVVVGLFLLPAALPSSTHPAEDVANSANAPSELRESAAVPGAMRSRGDTEPQTEVTWPQSEFANKAQYDRMVAEVAHAYGLNSALLHAVISAESRYVSDAVSRKGAAGLMQLMPTTARRYGVTDPFDPVQNLNGGAKCLRDLLKKFNNNVSLALAAYNAGRGAVIRHGERIPPFGETEAYVQRVLSYYWRYQLEQAGIPQPWLPGIRRRV